MKLLLITGSWLGEEMTNHTIALNYLRTVSTLCMKLWELHIVKLKLSYTGKMLLDLSYGNLTANIQTSGPECSCNNPHSIFYFDNLPRHHRHFWGWFHKSNIKTNTLWNTDKSVISNTLKVVHITFDENLHFIRSYSVTQVSRTGVA